jgi:hypothetical protein
MKDDMGSKFAALVAYGTLPTMDNDLTKREIKRRRDMPSVLEFLFVVMSVGFLFLVLATVPA